MPKTEVSVPHNLGKDEAIQRLQGMLSSVKENYGNQVSDLQENWTADGGTFSFKAMGFKISGVLTVTDDDMRVQAEFPWAAKPFQSTIEAAIRERAERLLA